MDFSGVVGRRSLPVLAVLSALAFSACSLGDSPSGDSVSGQSASPRAELGAKPLPTRRSATIVLDYLPNAVHAGIYRAKAAGYYDALNVAVKVIAPTSTADTLKLIDAGRADLGLADGIDIATQIADGRDARAVLALTQRPLGGLITRQEAEIVSARDLEGKTVGLTGVPSDTAVFRAIVAGAGGDPDKVEQVTIGFNGAQALQAKRIDGFTGYWPADAVQLQVKGTPTRVFSLDDAGGPAYPGLVAFTTRRRLRADRPLITALVAATRRGYEDALQRPAQAISDLLAAVPTLDRKVTAAQLRAYRSLWRPPGETFGRIDAADIRGLSDFLQAGGVIDRPVSADRFGAELIR